MSLEGEIVRAPRESSKVRTRWILAHGRDKQSVWQSAVAEIYILAKPSYESETFSHERSTRRTPRGVHHFSVTRHAGKRARYSEYILEETKLRGRSLLSLAQNLTFCEWKITPGIPDKNGNPTTKNAGARVLISDDRYDAVRIPFLVLESDRPSFCFFSQIISLISKHAVWEEDGSRASNPLSLKYNSRRNTRPRYLWIRSSQWESMTL